jgi:hypothetical protein
MIKRKLAKQIGWFGVGWGMTRGERALDTASNI